MQIFCEIKSPGFDPDAAILFLHGKYQLEAVKQYRSTNGEYGTVDLYKARSHLKMRITGINLCRAMEILYTRKCICLKS